MATKAHCIYCFESLSARLENRPCLTLREVESLWSNYDGQDEHDFGTTDALIEDIPEHVLAEEENEEDMTDSTRQHNLRPRQLSKIQNASPASSSNASTPSNLSSQNLSNEISKASSRTSLSSLSTTGPTQKEEEYPLFVTWNTTNSRGRTSLRGCIGTFENTQLSRGLKDYALTSAFNDVRFAPIASSELSSLSCDVTLLLNFTPCKDPLDWEIGTHGIRISFTYHSRRYSSTYLPQVAPEQGWTKEETLVSLMKKAGWSGRSSEWRNVNDLKCIRYEGKKAEIDYTTFKAWKDWLAREQIQDH